MARRFWNIQISFALSYHAGRWVTHTYLPPSAVTLDEFPQYKYKETNAFSIYIDKILQTYRAFQVTSTN
jgi:hypothetical protein